MLKEGMWGRQENCDLDKSHSSTARLYYIAQNTNTSVIKMKPCVYGRGVAWRAVNILLNARLLTL
jgi:hypothetical protein